jgi:hypothetical protein
MKRFTSSVVTSVVLLGGLSLVIGSTRAVSAQSDPAIGNWKLNLAKSKYTPGPLPKSQTATITAAGTGIKVSTKGMDAEGKPTLTEYTVGDDGKDAPVKGNPAYDATSLKRIDASTTELARKRAGKVVQTARRAVSADGKTMTVTTTGTNEKGVKINNVAVYDRQ